MIEAVAAALKEYDYEVIFVMTDQPTQQDNEIKENLTDRIKLIELPQELWQSTAMSLRALTSPPAHMLPCIRR